MTEVEVAVKLAEHDNRIKVSEHRIDDLESNQKEINALTVSVHELARSVESMVSEQKDQNERLKKIEMEPGNNFKSLKTTIISSIISTVVGIALGALIAIIAKGVV